MCKRSLVGVSPRFFYEILFTNIGHLPNSQHYKKSQPFLLNLPNMGFMHLIQLKQNAILDNLFWVQPF